MKGITFMYGFAFGPTERTSMHYARCPEESGPWLRSTARRDDLPAEADADAFAAGVLRTYRCRKKNTVDESQAYLLTFFISSGFQKIVLALFVTDTLVRIRCQGLHGFTWRQQFVELDVLHSSGIAAIDFRMVLLILEAQGGDHSNGR